MLKLSPGRPSTAAYRPVVIKTPIEELLDQPGREKRPEKLVVIFRGVPGSGKSFTAKLIKVSVIVTYLFWFLLIKDSVVKEREVENGGVGPRILCFDDYFMTDEEEETTSKPGRKSTEKAIAHDC